MKLKDEKDFYNDKPLNENCPKCNTGKLHLKSSYNGLFANYSEWLECDTCKRIWVSK